MRLLYSLGIRCYVLAVRLASPFNPKAKQMLQGWKEVFGHVAVSPVGKGKTAWFHASSLGEFEQARPVLEAFRKAHPEYKVCVTFFSPSGYEVRKNYPEADFVCYLPPDTRANAIRFLNMLRPTVAFFVKYDFWFNYLEQLRRRDVPTYLFSAIFRPRQYFFQWYGTWFFRHLRDCFTHLFVQNEESCRLLQEHGIGHVSIAGDTRFDRVNAIAEAARRFPEVERMLAFHPDWPVLLAGSSWEPDERMLAQYLRQRQSPCYLIVAPHVVSDSHLDMIENELFKGERCTHYSRLAEADSNSRVLIIDNVGLLSALYRYAHVAYIGGGFGKGIHNILEALAFGKPVVFGPNYHKFQEAHDIIGLGGGFSFQHFAQMKECLDRLLDDPDHYSRTSQTCRDYLERHTGSTSAILSVVSQRIINL
ncbi:MAG: 3-deoxy-D-manno-octulosonic acid transferase [Bacteroidales bacterium]|nr:3-deoxy-D-manno-octulosonic acid transferase [Bacteroidales bacterium]